MERDLETIPSNSSLNDYHVFSVEFGRKMKRLIKKANIKYININKFRIRKSILATSLIIVIVAASIINFNVFLMGSASNLHNVITTIVYIIFWFAFIWLSKTNRNNLIFSVIWSLLTFACAVATLAVNINNKLIIDFVIPFAMIFITPFYGIESFFSRREFLIASIIITIISLTWATMSFIFLNQKEKTNK